MASVSINAELCKGCELCIAACPKSILELDSAHINAKGNHPAHCVDQSQCTGCASCARMCPDTVITVER